MHQVSLENIRAGVFACLDQARDRVLAHGLERATGFGFWIDGLNCGCGVALNEDDDELYRCGEIASFTQRQFFGLGIGELERLDRERSRERTSGAEPGRFASLAPDGVEIMHADLEGFCARLYKLTVSWVDEWFKTPAAKALSPCWIVVEESVTGKTKIRRVKKQPLPPALAEAAEPLGIRGFTPVPEGMKVYRLTTGRKYTGITVDFVPGLPRMEGRSLAGAVDAPLNGQKEQNEWRKHGGLSRLGGCFNTFALRENHPAFAEARAFLQPMAELVPAFDGTETWHLANVLVLASVLEPDASACRIYAGKIDEVQFAEFNDEALRQARHPVFKLVETPASAPYFLERPGEECFVHFCGRTGLRGADWELIWCEDRAAVERGLEEFVTRLEARILRMEGECKVERYLHYQCINRLQAHVWRIAKFREIFTRQGITEALRLIPAAGSLGLTALRRKLPGQWQYENHPRPQGIESSLTKALQRRDLLLDLRGYLCRILPVVTRELDILEMARGEDALDSPA